MAKFEFDGIDDVMADLNTVEIECPDCGQSFEIDLDDMDSAITCPHCGAKMEKI